MAKARAGGRIAARAGKAARNTIAFQGEPGANSDMACHAAFPYMTTLPCPTFDAAMGVVQAGQAELAIIPVENSIAGRVADLHSLLPHTKLKIVAEHFQRVEHCLVALPGVTLKDVKVVKSHVQALSQCRNFLKKHGIAPLVHADTAGAAREIAEEGERRVGAIASSLAARIYGLRVLARNIEDADHNTTRMLVFSRDAARPDWRTVRCMTAFLFRVKSVPAALYKALGGFATNGVNIVKLESYLSGAHFEQAQFYAEVEGHPEQRGLQLAFEELRFFSEELKLLGSFPANPFRRKGWDAPTRPGT
jgi:prephenate dehydratase